MRIVRHQLLRRTALFSISIAASTIVGIFSIPTLVSALGAQSWGHLAVMQAVAQFFAVMVAFGWGATGPSMVSAAVPEGRKRIYVESLVFRLMLLMVFLPVAAVFCALLTGEAGMVSVLAATSYVLPGMGAAWYFIGTNRPAALFVFDALPPILGQVSGLGAALIFGTLEAYLACTAIFGLVGVVLAAVYVLTRASDGGTGAWSRVPWRAIILEQAPGVTSSIAASIWSAAPLTLVQILAPSLTATFAMVDRFLKYAVLALAPILQAIQGWIAEAGAAAIPARSSRALQISIGVGVAGGLMMAILATPVSSLLSLGQAVVPVGVSVLAGLAILFECVSQITGLSSMVVLGLAGGLAWSSALATIVGIPLTAVMIAGFGVAGAVGALAIIAGTQAAYRVLATRRALRGLPAAPAGGGGTA